MNLYLFHKPGEDSIHHGASPELLTGLGEGFVFSAFSEENNFLTIQPEEETTSLMEENKEVIEKWIAANDEAYVLTQPESDQSTLKEEHIEYIRSIKSVIEDSGNDIAKIVGARMQISSTHKSAYEIFATLAKQNPDAFTFLFSTAQSGTWIGASPERVMIAKGRQILVDSLAGTRKISETPWDEKNIEEQRIVTDYILDNLRREGMTPTIQGPHSRRCGEIEHIATEIRAEMPEYLAGIDRNCHDKRMEFISRIVKRLSPTPAISGFPKEETIQFINAHEPAKRGYYGGVVGEIDEHQDAWLYVNLRSGRFDSLNSQMRLYAGGGITAGSNEEEEWEETNRKLTTMRKSL